MENKNLNREIKSSLFIDYFGKDEVVGKKNFLELYNAIHDSDLKLEDTRLELTDIDNTVYKTFQNDLGMMVNGRLVVLMEHQSTINPNMPLRLLEYVTKIYSGLLESRLRYSTRLASIPSPEFYVFYNGKSPMPAESVLKLSDAYMEKLDKETLELKVTVFNLNSADLQLNNKSATLKAYNQFVNYFYANTDLKNPKSCERTLNNAFRDGLLPNYLDRKIKEVRNMFLAEYDYNEDIAVKKEEAYDDGFNDGFGDGAEKTKIEDAKSLVFQLHLSLEEVSKYLKLTPKQQEILEKEIDS